MKVKNPVAVVVVAFILIVGFVFINKFYGSFYDQEVTFDTSKASADKLNTVQGEIATLSDTDLEKEIVELKAKFYDEGLLEQLNKNQLAADEKEDAKKMLLRLALLRIEKAKRGSATAQLDK